MPSTHGASNKSDLFKIVVFDEFGKIFDKSVPCITIFCPVTVPVSSLIDCKNMVFSRGKLCKLPPRDRCICMAMEADQHRIPRVSPFIITKFKPIDFSGLYRWHRGHKHSYTHIYLLIRYQLENSYYYNPHRKIPHQDPPYRRGLDFLLSN